MKNLSKHFLSEWTALRSSEPPTAAGAGGEIEISDCEGHCHAEIGPCEMTHSPASFSHPEDNPGS